ncbi:MAG TPA: DUF3556 domain-containing protein, partial [Polyangiales bacterium]|nr:DUF3556 domain-containing protein [Polyangiales bacterium]
AYAALVVCTLLALTAAAPTRAQLLPIALLLPALAVLDKTLFLCARGEHYWTTIAIFVLASDFLPGAKALHAALWFWAGVSKLNHHFPAVVGVMTSNSPITRFAWLRKLMYRDYPNDLRPSQLATVMGHAGTLLEMAVPVVLLTGSGGTHTLIGLLLMLGLHGFITSNVPMGVPLEWNMMMVYGGFFLFWKHADVSVLAMTPPVAALVLVIGVLVPLLGNLFPERVPFLLAMRYYAGNWAYNIWLIRRDALPKLDRLTKFAGTMREQLASLLPDPQQVDIACSMSLAHRFMHLEGRPLLEALPKAVDDIDAYEWMDGEVFGGMVVGWNFGDGHLNDTQLLDAVQAQCGFEDGEVRVVMVESQPLFGRTMRWKVADAKRGVITEGETAIAPMRAIPPWPTGPSAEALGGARLRAV